MNETSKEQREERRKSSGFIPLTSCHDDAAAHSMETVVNGKEESVGHGVAKGRSTLSQGSGFSLHSFPYYDHSTPSAARVGRGAGNADSSCFGVPSLDCHGNHSRNGSCLEPERKRLLESCCGGNGAIDVRPRQSNGRGSLGRSSSLSGCNEDLAAQHHEFLNGFLNSIDELRLGNPSAPVESSVSVETSILNADGGEQTDAGYMDDIDAFVDSGNDAPALHSGHGRGLGMHFAFDMEAGAAGGGVGAIGLEDFGDFIDADIPPHRTSSSQFSSRSNDSLTSSFEELSVTTGAIDNAGAEEAEDLACGGERPRPISMALQSMTRQRCNERVLDFPVNNLNQVDRRRTTVNGPANDILTTQSQSSIDSTSTSDSMNFASLVIGAKSWRWSDGDAVGNVLPSMVAAASQTSDSSHGTPSVPLVSPFSVEDDILASATSSPLTPSRPHALSTLDFDPIRCSNHLGGSRTSRDEARGNAVCYPPVLQPNMGSALLSRVNLLQNLNQGAPKHVLEKYFDWEATASAPSNAAAAASRHSGTGSNVAAQGVQSEDYVDAACQQCGLEALRRDDEVNGSRLCDLPKNFERHFADRWPENMPLDMQKNRRFSAQNLMVTDSLEFSEGLSSTKGKGRAWDSDAMTLSDDNLHSPHFAKRPQPSSLHLSWHSNHDYIECSHLVRSNQNAGLFEMGVRPKDAKAKKLSSEALFLSLSEDDDDNEDGEEGQGGHPRRQRNKNGRHHVKCRDDKSLSRLTDSPSITTSCGACLIIILLRHLGVTDVSHRVYELMHANRSLDKASLPEYLLASSTAGVDAETLVDRLAQLTENRIYGKFFHLFPQRNINLIHWLKYWTKKGAVPLATLKCKTKVDSGETGVWHHKIISTSWIQAVNDSSTAATEDDLSLIWLSSDSSIRISRQQVVTRWRDDCDLSVLMSCTDVRWQEMNVLGQVVNILREERLQTVGSCKPQLTPHVVIPTHFKSGVTLYFRKDSAGYKELQRTGSELPLVDHTTQDSATKISLAHDKNQNKRVGLVPGVEETVIF